MRVGRPILMVDLGGVHLTPDHPIQVDSGWARPTELAKARRLHVHELFNFVLSIPGPLTLKAAGQMEAPLVVACTLGQSVPRFPDAFYGTRQVIEHMSKRPDWPNMVTEV